MAKDGNTYYVSDGFHQIKCVFSDICMANFEEMYPSCIKLKDIVNMMICVYDYELQLVTPFKHKSNIIDSHYYRNQDNTKSDLIFRQNGKVSS